MVQPISLPIFHTPVDSGRERDTSRPVLLIGFQNQGNLGLGYPRRSVAKNRVTSVHVVDIEQEPEKILKIGSST